MIVFLLVLDPFVLVLNSSYKIPSTLLTGKPVIVVALDSYVT